MLHVPHVVTRLPAILAEPSQNHPSHTCCAYNTSLDAVRANFALHVSGKTGFESRGQAIHQNSADEETEANK